MMPDAVSPALRPAAPRQSWVLAAGLLIAFGAASGVALAFGQVEAFFVTLALVGCLGVLADFRFGAVLIIAILPFSASTVFPHQLMGITALNPLNLLLGATFVSYVIGARAQPARPVLRWQLLVLYVAPILVGGLIGVRRVDEIVPDFYEFEIVNFTDAFGYVRDLVLKPLVLVVAALLIGGAAARSRHPEKFIVPIALSVWFVALVQIGYFAVSGVDLGALASARERQFFAGIGIHANDLARLYATAFALLLFTWWMTKRPGMRLFLFATMVVLGFGLLLTFSRGGFLGAAVVSGLFLVRHFSAKTASLALMAGLVFLVFAPGYLLFRLTLGFGEGDLDAISAGRVDGIWTPLLPELGTSPIWGSGIGSILWSAPMKADAMLLVGHPHNAYLEAALDFGFVGLALLLAFYAHVGRGFLALGRSTELSPELRGFFQGAFAALACFLVTGMAGSSLRPAPEFAHLWMAIGMMYGCLARRQAG